MIGDKTYVCITCGKEGLFYAMAILEAETNKILPECITCFIDRLGIRAIYEELEEKEQSKARCWKN